ncbi:hypothetical protein MTO96_029590 [Rhipicephalus appendiculatus]
MPCRTSSAKHIYTGGLHCGNRPVAITVGPAGPARRPASTSDGCVPGHGLAEHLRHPDCPASPRRPDTDNPVVPVL